MYTTEEKVEQYLQVDIDDSISAYVTDWINWVTKYIDKYTGTTFEAAAQTYYYDGRGGDSLYFDDLVSITQIDFLDEDGDVQDTLTTGDYFLYPLNRSPKTHLKLNPWGDFMLLPTGPKRIKIQGLFGVDSTVPADIEWVATRMVANIIRDMTDTGKDIKSESLGEYSVTFNDMNNYSTPEYMTILDLYRTPVV